MSTQVETGNQPEKEFSKADLRNRLEEIDGRLKPLYEQEQELDIQIERLNKQLDSLDEAKHDLVLERGNLQRQLYPEIFG